MSDIEQELWALTRALDAAGVAYAVCGGLALAVHGHPRATKGIDLVVQVEALAAAQAVARACGFVLEALPMRFEQSGIEVRRVSKLTGSELLMLDLLLANEALQPVWQSRFAFPWRDGTIWCVSRAALVSMKLAAGRPQDLADVARLAESA